MMPEEFLAPLPRPSLTALQQQALTETDALLPTGAPLPTSVFRVLAMAQAGFADVRQRIFDPARRRGEAGRQYVGETGVFVPGMLGHGASVLLIDTPAEQCGQRRPGPPGADWVR